MLPKIKKNIFKAKVESAHNKTLNVKKMLISILFAGSTVMASATSSTLQTPEIDRNINQIVKVQKENSFTLQPSEKSIKALAYHYSHRSHYSHSSHRSHYSSRY